MKKNLLAGLAVGLMMFGGVGVASASLSGYVTLDKFSITTNGINGGSAPTISYGQGGSLYNYNGAYSRYYLSDQDSYEDSSSYKAGSIPRDVVATTNYTSASVISGKLMTDVSNIQGFYGNLFSDAYAVSGFTVSGQGIINISANYTYSSPLVVPGQLGEGSYGYQSAWLNLYQSDWGLIAGDSVDNGTPTSGNGTLSFSYQIDKPNTIFMIHSGANLQAQLNPPATPTPIPGAMLLFGSGLAGLVGLRRNKKD